MSTGSELREPGAGLGHDSIYDANSYMLAAAARAAGALAYRVGIVSDDPQEFADALSDQLVRADLVVTSGGVSKGQYDVVKEVLAELGYGATSFRRIADRAGLSSTGLISYHFKGKQELVDSVAGWGGRPDATVLGDGRLIPAHHAAMLNAALMRSFDFEPVGAEGPGQRQVAAHLTGTTVPVALAVGEREGSTGREILTALLVGEDIAARLAFGSGFDVYSGQDNTGTVNGVGATVVACLLMGLDEERTRHALGLAVNQLAGTVASIFDHASAFKLPMAFAARNAIRTMPARCMTERMWEKEIMHPRQKSTGH